MNKAVSDYMRDMQRRSADARWSGLSEAEKRAKMSALAKARWPKPNAKPRARALRQNDKLSEPPTKTP